ncbi:hypothetical protein [Butyrivibrio sp. AC2005]|uniref:hypothetical protein n=1 Tax=Butyrivibrio sp. AC2005 TaxID=1280672 RepID=UPI000402E699|nr:hypothetical protein [Butyrivibrio sp. AC2005]
MRKKPITYEISEGQIEYIQEHTFNVLYDKTLYWLFSERMPMLYPFLQDKKKENVSLEELLQYCYNQQIEVYPMTFRRNKLLTNISEYREEFKMYRRGILIKSDKISKLIVEYAKYCLANFPVGT